jgi:DnaJ-domain-containing protein 1
MKIAILAIAALVGFWLVSTILERLQSKPLKTGGSSRPRSGPAPQPEPESTSGDPIDEACRVLQLTRPFTAEQLRAAYRQRMSEYHPDKVSGLGQELQVLAESKSKEINTAFDFLEKFSR